MFIIFSGGSSDKDDSVFSNDLNHIIHSSCTQMKSYVFYTSISKCSKLAVHYVNATIL